MTQKPLPLVSIICLTYNHEHYVEDAIKGFIMQKVDFPIEVIIHEDASTDGTAAIIKEYHERFPDMIIPVYQKENQFSKGIGVIRKIVFGMAKGKYICYCEGDDFWTDPLKLQKQVHFLENNPDFAMVHTDFEESFENNAGIRRGLLGTVKPRVKSGDIFFDLLQANFIGTLTSCVRADIIKNLDGIYTKNYAYDYWLWLKIAEDHKINYLNQPTASYRIHGESLTAKKSFFNVRMFYVMEDAIFSYLGKNPYSKLSPQEKDIIVWALFRIIKCKGMPFQDKKAALKFIGKDPRRISRLFKMGISKAFITLFSKSKSLPL